MKCIVSNPFVMKEDLIGKHGRVQRATLKENRAPNMRIPPRHRDVSASKISELSSKGVHSSRIDPNRIEG